MYQNHTAQPFHDASHGKLNTPSSLRSSTGILTITCMFNTNRDMQTDSQVILTSRDLFSAIAYLPQVKKLFISFNSMWSDPCMPWSTHGFIVHWVGKIKSAVHSAFGSMKPLGVFIVPTGWDANPAFHLASLTTCQYPFILLGGEWCSESKLFYSNN